MIQDKFLQSLVQKQTDLLNADAPEIERVLVFRQIQDYQKTLRKE